MTELRDAMARSAKLTFKSDPFASDPPRAAELYEAVGRYVRVWSQLEEHFNSTLITMLHHPAVHEVREKLNIDRDGPISFTRKLRLWRTLWTSVSAFRRFEKRAHELSDRMREANTDRNKLLHSAWQTFTDAQALEVRSSSWRLKGGEILSSPVIFNLSNVLEMTAIADELNTRLLPFTLAVTKRS